MLEDINCWKSTADLRVSTALQHPVTGSLNQSAAVAFQRRLQPLGPMLLQARKRTSFVSAHEPRVHNHIRRQDSG